MFYSLRLYIDRWVELIVAIAAPALYWLLVIRGNSDLVFTRLNFITLITLVAACGLIIQAIRFQRIATDPSDKQRDFTQFCYMMGGVCWLAVLAMFVFGDNIFGLLILAGAILMSAMTVFLIGSHLREWIQECVWQATANKQMRQMRQQRQLHDRA